jgi:hypothetical protein
MRIEMKVLIGPHVTHWNCQIFAKHRNEGGSIQAIDLASRGGHFGLMKWLHKNRKEGSPWHGRY